VKERPSDDWKHIVWLDELYVTVLPTSDWVYVWTSPKEAYSPECLVSAVKRGARS